MATNKVLIGSSPTAVSHAQMKELHAQFESGSLNKDHLQAFLRHENPFSLDNVVIDWVKVYKLLGMKNEFGRAGIIYESTSRLWPVPVIKGVTSNVVVRTLRNIGVGVDLYTEHLDTAVEDIDRDPVSNGSYLAKFAKTIEADPELHDKSANDLVKLGVRGITLRERLLLELGYFLTTENHLDIKNITLCSGSRYSSGCVPVVTWGAVRPVVNVHRLLPDRSDGHIRSRALVL